jgi:hypothetical protein
MSLPSSGLESTPSKKPSFCFMLVSCLAYSSSLKIEVTRSSYFRRTTWRYFSEARTYHKHSCDNLKLYICRALFRWWATV